jgi:hypothetical protein
MKWFTLADSTSAYDVDGSKKPGDIPKKRFHSASSTYSGSDFGCGWPSASRNA